MLTCTENGRSSREGRARPRIRRSSELSEEDEGGMEQQSGGLVFERRKDGAVRNDDG